MADRLIVGVTGASGAPLAVETLRLLRETHPEVETHLVVTRGGALALRHECGLTPDDVRPLVHTLHDVDAIGDAIASGSFATLGMLVVPCSMKTAAGVCSGYADNLLLRAADVCLKEGRKLVLAARESPLSAVHLRNLCALSQMGVVIAPPMLSYYNKPQTLDDMTRQTARRLLAWFGLSVGAEEWKGLSCADLP